MNLAEFLATTAARLPAKPAVVVGARQVSYRSLNDAADAVAESMRSAGIGPGHKVAMSAPNGPEFIAAMMGILRAGGVAVPCAADLQPPEREEMVRRVGCHVDLALRAPEAGETALTPFDGKAARTLTLRRCPENANLPPDDRLIAVGASNIRFTSGTTAAYKGVVLSHRSIAERIEVANRALHISDRDVIYFGLPMAHHFAVSVMLHLSVGATIVTGGMFLGDAMVEQVRRHRATVIYTTPITFRMMSEAPNGLPEALASVRLALSTAMTLTPEVQRRFEARFDKPLGQALGIIEVGMPIMNLPGAGFIAGSLGRLVPGFEARIVDEHGADAAEDAPGELWLRGPGMLAAYYDPWRTREQILPDGWFRTGDVVRRDTSGQLFLLGRSKHVINVGGTKVFPYEIEQVLLSHPAVAEAAVFPEPEDVLGEVPAAAVVLRGGTSADEAALAAHCAERLSPFKRPRTIRILAELPRTHSGKVAVSALASKPAAE